MPQTTDRRLVVLCQSSVAGVLDMDMNGPLSFAYDDAYAGPGLSVSLPRDGRMIGGNAVSAWFEGLSPDACETRAGMAIDAGNKHGANSAFGPLSDYGMDLPGATQVTAEDNIDAVLTRPSKCKRISRHAMGKRLRSMIDDGGHTKEPWSHGDGHWSLGGNQGKIAVMEKDGEYYACEGNVPSTIIIRPGIKGLEDEALVECMSMRLAHNCGLSIAPTHMGCFDDIDAIVIDGYDRMRIGDMIYRLHQEDVCQALSIHPSKKYAADGGPSATTTMSLLSRDETGTSLQRLYDALIFNCLIGATDAHAKNCSLIHDHDNSVFLAPLYDIATVTPYMTNWEEYKVAMGIGNDARIGRLRGSMMARFAKTTGINTQWAKDRTLEIADRTKRDIEPTMDEFTNPPHADRIASAMRPRIGLLCDACMQSIDANGKKCLHPRLVKAVPLSRHMDKTIGQNDGMIWVEPHMRGNTFIHGCWRHARKTR